MIIPHTCFDSYRNSDIGSPFLVELSERIRPFSVAIIKYLRLGT